jgi:hypothetical protein
MTVRTARAMVKRSIRNMRAEARCSPHSAKIAPLLQMKTKRAVEAELFNVDLKLIVARAGRDETPAHPLVRFTDTVNPNIKPNKINVMK